MKKRSQPASSPPCEEPVILTLSAMAKAVAMYQMECEKVPDRCTSSQRFPGRRRLREGRHAPSTLEAKQGMCRTDPIPWKLTQVLIQAGALEVPALRISHPRRNRPANHTPRRRMLLGRQSHNRELRCFSGRDSGRRRWPELSVLYLTQLSILRGASFVSFGKGKRLL